MLPSHAAFKRRVHSSTQFFSNIKVHTRDASSSRPPCHRSARFQHLAFAATGPHIHTRAQHGRFPHSAAHQYDRQHTLNNAVYGQLLSQLPSSQGGAREALQRARRRSAGPAVCRGRAGRAGRRRRRARQQVHGMLCSFLSSLCLGGKRRRYYFCRVWPGSPG
jgi:hypothetical protein